MKPAYIAMIVLGGVFIVLVCVIYKFTKRLRYEDLFEPNPDYLPPGCVIGEPVKDQSHAV